MEEKKRAADSGFSVADGLQAEGKIRAGTTLEKSPFVLKKSALALEQSHLISRGGLLHGWDEGPSPVLRCDRCGQEILRLETYIAVGSVTLCDRCYMNMPTKEFLAKVGGELRVME